MSKKIVVGIPTKDRPSVREAIITAAFELSKQYGTIIVNDGGMEGDSIIMPETANMCRALGVGFEIIFQSSEGLVGAKNEIIERAEIMDFDYLMFMDDDCIMVPGCMEELTFWLRNKKIEAVAPCIFSPTNPGGRYKQWAFEEQKPFEARGNTFCVRDGKFVWNYKPQVYRFAWDHSVISCDYFVTSFMARKEAIEEVGYFDENLSGAGAVLEEVDYTYRLSKIAKSKIAKIMYVPQAMVFHLQGYCGGLMEEKSMRTDEDILKNFQYFAKKHGLGEVTSFDRN